MHELPVINSILRIVLEHAKKNSVEKVVSISLRIGEITDLVDEWMQRYFDYVSKNTIAEGAKLKIERSPVIFQCDACRNTFRVQIGEIGNVLCSACGDGDVKLISGREYYIKDIEVI